jgi:MFS family permease
MTISFGWRSIFTINVPLGIIAFVLVATQMIESRAEVADPVDVAGGLSLAAGVTALLFAVLHRPGEHDMGWILRGVLLLAAAASLATFVRLQTRRKHPLIPPELFRKARTAAPYVGGVLLGTTIYGVDTYVPLFVQGARGGTAGAAGAVVTPLVFLWALSATVAARLIVRFGFRRTARWGAILTLFGLTALVVTALLNASVPWISAACAVVGAGLGPSSMSQVLAIQNVVSEKQRGVATSLVPFFRVLGGAVGVGALGGLFAVGLSSRLGAAAESAGRMLAAGHAAPGGPPVDPAVFRLAIEHALLPVFGILAALAVFNVMVTARFPECAVEPSESAEKMLLSVE